MSKLITGDNERIVQFYQRLKETLIALESALKEKRPLLNGQRYMTDAELSQYLKLSRRTLQEYRNNGLVPYYQIGGKILYRESDIEELLKETDKKLLNRKSVAIRSERKIQGYDFSGSSWLKFQRKIVSLAYKNKSSICVKHRSQFQTK